MKKPMKNDTPRTCRAAAKLRALAIVWAAECRKAPADSQDSGAAAADRRLRRAAEAYTDAARALRGRTAAPRRPTT